MMWKDGPSFTEELKNAMTNEQIVLYLQPKYDTKREEIYGAEVLVRWQHPEQGLLEPREFLPQCEEYDLMRLLDDYVWEHACRLLEQWQISSENPCYLSVKVSKSSLYQTEIAQNVQKYVEQYHIAK